MATNERSSKGPYASFAQGDVPAALSAFADDIHWTEPDGYPLAGTYVGHQAVVNGVFMRLGEIGDEFAVCPTSSSPTVDTVVALGTSLEEQEHRASRPQ
jgi:ketosteroid isomerase-like protein